MSTALITKTKGGFAGSSVSIMNKLFNLKYLPFAPLAILIFGSTFCFSEEINNRAVIETAKQMNLSVGDVNRDAIDGCSGSQLSMNVCEQYHFVVEDLKLNDLYSALQTRLGTSKAKILLKKSQRAWITFRDTTCEYESQGVEGGTLHGAYALDCMKRLTIERSKHLESYLSCTSNDCPGNDAE